MKKVFLNLLILVLMTSCASQKNINALFNDYRQKENARVTSLPVGALKILPLSGITGVELLQDIEDLKILTIDGMDKAERKAFNSRLVEALKADNFTERYFDSKDNKLKSVNTQGKLLKLNYVVLAYEYNGKITLVKSKTSISKLELKKLISLIKKVIEK